jgi:chemotaxis protein histidine kinase CheA
VASGEASLSIELEKRVSGDWFDLKEAVSDPVAAAAAAGLDPIALKQIADRLRYSVEEGIMEFKRTTLLSILSTLDSLTYDSRAFTSLESGAVEAAAASWACLQQRRIALGREKIEETRERGAHLQEEKKEPPVDTATVFETVHKLFSKYPELKNEPAGKMVILQLKQYRQEMAKLKELMENIPQEKRKPLRENFAYRLHEILEKVQQGCETLQESVAETEKDDKEETEGFVLTRVDQEKLASLSKRFLQEAEHFNRFRSVMRFAIEEKYRSRQSLMSLKKTGDELQSLFKLESSDFRTLSPFGDGAARISMEMAHIVRRVALRTAEEL